MELPQKGQQVSGVGGVFVAITATWDVSGRTLGRKARQQPRLRERWPRLAARPDTSISDPHTL